MMAEDLSSLPIDAVPDHKASASDKSEPTPRKSVWGSKAKSSQTRSAPPKLTAGVKTQLKDLYSGLGALIEPFDEVAGRTIINQADQCAESVYTLAQQNDSVRRFLLYLTQSSAVGAVVLAHLPIVIALARHSSNQKLAEAANMGVMAMNLKEFAGEN